MRKTQVLGAAALVLVLGAGASECVLASGAAVQSAGTGLLGEAATAIAKPQSSLSEKYPGIDKYLQDLTNKYDGSAGATAALTEATEAVNLLKNAKEPTRAKVETQAKVVVEATPHTVTQNTTRAANYNVHVAAEVVEKKTAETKVSQQGKQVATNIAVKVEEKPAAQAEAAAEKSDDKTAEAEAEQPKDEPETVELPKTGEETPKASVGQLILAGVAVVIITVGLTVMVLKGKKNI